MLRQAARLRPPSLHRTVRFSRRTYNGGPVEPKTYFQPPPKPAPKQRRWPRILLTASLLTGAGAWTLSSLFGLQVLPFALRYVDDEFPEKMKAAGDAAEVGIQHGLATEVPLMTVEAATTLLRLKSSFNAYGSTVTHTCQLPSNFPCEDVISNGHFRFTKTTGADKNWQEWGIYDGHAGPRTAHALAMALPRLVGQTLHESGLMARKWVPGDGEVIRGIKQAFLHLDDNMFEEGRRKLLDPATTKADGVSMLSNIMAGSCALLAMFDPIQNVFRVACTGDCRAVLGRFDTSTQSYAVIELSQDQTGFNESEIARLSEQHPGEEGIVTDGRVFGIAVSRAFGDHRWKWPDDLVQLAQDRFWGPSPRPGSVIMSPPYLTAEPEVTETQIVAGLNGDFVIMASAGLWDQISSEDAVKCVEFWMGKNKGADCLTLQNKPTMTSWLLGSARVSSDHAQTPSPPLTETSESLSSPEDEEDTFVVPEEGLKWHTKPKYFVNEDDNAAVHLIKNALGGKRRGLFCGVMSVQAPLSCNVRDDISVHVIFFGQDEKLIRENAERAWQ